MHSFLLYNRCVPLKSSNIKSLSLKIILTGDISHGENHADIEANVESIPKQYDSNFKMYCITICTIK